MLTDIRRGISKTGMMALGYAAIGFAVAATSYGAGLSAWNTLMLSFLVYAGSAQLAATQLWLMEASPTSIIATTFIVNLRHLLMSSALAQYVRQMKKKQLAFFSFQLTDEAFAVHSQQIANGHKPNKAEILTINLVLHAAWILGAILAIALGTSGDVLEKIGLDYAPAAMFIALLALLIRDQMQLYVAILSGLIALVLHQIGWGTWGVIVTTFIGATVGILGDTWIKKKHSIPSSAWPS